MSKPTKEFEEAYRRLINSVDALKNEVEAMLPQIREALDPNHELPENRPSDGSLAELIFREVRKKQSGVNYAIEECEKAFWKIELVSIMK